MLCEVDHITFAFRTTEGITFGHVVVMKALSDMSCQLTIHVVIGEQEGTHKAYIHNHRVTLNCWCIGVAGPGHCGGYEGWLIRWLVCNHLDLELLPYTYIKEG